MSVFIVGLQVDLVAAQLHARFHPKENKAMSVSESTQADADSIVGSRSEKKAMSVSESTQADAPLGLVAHVDDDAPLLGERDRNEGVHDDGLGGKGQGGGGGERERQERRRAKQRQFLEREKREKDSGEAVSYGDEAPKTVKMASSLTQVVRPSSPSLSFPLDPFLL